MTCDDEKCPSIEELYEYIDEEADIASLQAVRMHVQHCETCAQTVNQIRRLTSGLANLHTADSYPDLAAQYYGRRPARPSVAIFRWAKAWVRGVSARRVSLAGVVAVVLVSFLAGLALDYESPSGGGQYPSDSLDALMSYLSEQPGAVDDSDSGFLIDLVRLHVEEEYRVSTGFAREAVGVSCALDFEE